MEKPTVEYLLSVIKVWNIRKCEECGEYDLPSRGGGVGGIQSNDLGTDAKGRTVHRRCVK